MPSKRLQAIFRSNHFAKNAIQKLSSYTRLERIALGAFGVLFVTSVTLLGTNLLSTGSVQGSPSYGGTFIEALVGQPQYINPLLASSNDTDRDISALIFSSLMKYSENGDLEFDLAEDFTTQNFGKTYRFYLRKNVLWHDGEPFTADDVVYTIEAVQNPLYRSALSINWQGVTVSKIDDFTVEFNLKNVYAPFISNTTLQILPEHIWKQIDPTDFRESVAEQTPIGTGPYKFEQSKTSSTGEVSELSLSVNQNWYHRKAFIKSVIFKFYKTEEEAKNAFKRSRVDAFAFLSADIDTEIVEKENTTIIQPDIPRYFALFFNQDQTQILKEAPVRQALAHSIDKASIINGALSGNGEILNSPIPSHLIEPRNDMAIYDFDTVLAEQLLDENNISDSDGDGVREFNGESISLTITTPDLPELVRVANEIKTSWEKLQVPSIVRKISTNEIISSAIRPRDYEVLLFGQVLGHEPDPFSFWHSSQIKDPGLNLALYQNPQVDALLEEARQTLDQDIRESKYQEFSNVLMSDIPAVFLYTPVFTYAVNGDVKGISATNINVPTERFAGISEWHLR